MEFHYYITLFVAMLAIMNPLGSVAIYAGLVADRTDAEQKQQARVASFAILIILCLITWIGPYILDFFGISIAAFETAGGLIIVLLGLSMMNGHDEKSHSSMHHSEEEHEEALQKESIAVVPLSIPIIAGPGAISTILIHSHKLTGFTNHIVTTIVCAILALIMFICLFYSNKIKQLLGNGGIKIATRVMGLILMAIAFEMLGSGLTKLLPGLAG
jgi:multiple antibiotic resistance protein